MLKTKTKRKQRDSPSRLKLTCKRRQSTVQGTLSQTGIENIKAKYQHNKERHNGHVTRRPHLIRPITVILSGLTKPNDEGKGGERESGEEGERCKAKGQEWTTEKKGKGKRREGEGKEIRERGETDRNG